MKPALRFASQTKERFSNMDATRVDWVWGITP
jgi:hypothetical protein